MRHLRLTALMPLAPMLCLAAIGCGGGGDSGAAGNAPIGRGAADDSIATASVAGRAGGVTAIDAAFGDGAAMPPDSRGPSAYDLALARAAQASRAAAAPEATEPLPPEDSLADGG